MKTILILIAFFTISVQADTRRVFLGEMDLAGLVPETLPSIGSRINLSEPEQPVLDPNGNRIGYIPVLFRPAIVTMQENGLPLHVEVEHLYASPRAGQYIRVILWADTQDLSLIEPLIYDIPIHSEEDLSDYE